MSKGHHIYDIGEEETDFELTPDDIKELESLVKAHKSVKKLYNKVQAMEMDFYATAELSIKNTLIKLIKDEETIDVTSTSKLVQIQKGIRGCLDNMKIIELQQNKKDNKDLLNGKTDFEVRRLLKK